MLTMAMSLRGVGVPPTSFRITAERGRDARATKRPLPIARITSTVATVLNACVLFTGCAAAPATVDPATATPSAPAASADGVPLDAAAAPRRVYAIGVYRLAVPFGDVSGNDDFWKRIDETVVDPATYDLLYKNGLRVGAAPVAELGDLQDRLDADTAQLETVTADRAERVEMEMKLGLPKQVLFYYDSTADGVRAVGRSYDACDNVIYLSFRPVPGGGGAVELTMSPAVKSKRRRTEYTVRGNEVERVYDDPQTLYDLNLRVDLPLDHFLVVAPSAEASQETSVGHAFLTEDEPAERVEKVLVVLPEAREVGE